MNVIMAQLNTTVGDLKGNSKKIIETALSGNNGAVNVRGQWAQVGGETIIVYPELTITGYPPLDLVDNHRFIEDQLQCLDDIAFQTASTDTPLFVGFIDKNPGPGKNLYNSVAVIYKGQIVYKYHKRLLPTYDVFDEARYFEPGKEMGLWTFNGERIGITLCEDLWYDNKLYTINPAKDLYNAKADFIVSLNASPSVVRKHAYRCSMIAAISKQYSLPIFYVNQVGGNDDIIFDGNSFATDAGGNIYEHGASFREQIIHTSIEKENGKLIKSRIYENDAAFYYDQAVCGIRDYIQKNGFKGVVIGESGGIDSAVVTALAVAAVGAENVVGITMPTKYSSEGSYNDSEILCKNLGVKFHNLSIEAYFWNLVTAFNDKFEKKPSLMEENLQARIRGQILMAYSNRFGHLVLSTGNKSEVSVGYCTLYGDCCGGLSPISDLYKMEVYALAKHINEEIYQTEIIPQTIIDKAPSAELSPNQKDSDSLPPYPILDAILKLIIEGEVIDSDEKKEAMEKIKDYPDQVVKVLSLISKAEFKRRQAAIGLKMHRKSFGFGRRMPIVQKWPLSLFL